MGLLYLLCLASSTDHPTSSQIRTRLLGVPCPPVMRRHHGRRMFGTPDLSATVIISIDVRASRECRGEYTLLSTSSSVFFCLQLILTLVFMSIAAVGHWCHHCQLIHVRVRVNGIGGFVMSFPTTCCTDHNFTAPVNHWPRR